ncbi:MAG: serine/threonine-protein kinase [Planctomycetota bacterium]
MIASPSESSFEWPGGQLPEAKQERLAELMDAYLRGLERGLAPTIEELIDDDEFELIEPLRGYIDRLEDLHRIAVGFSPTQAPQEPSGGAKRLGDFELLEEIGRGGMGVVYRARQLTLQREVAIKLLPSGALLDSRQVDRFRNEAQAAASLNHPNIVPVYAVGCERGVHFYAMQFIDGQGVDDHIAESIADGRRPDWRSMVELGIQAADALDAAHEMGVIHRDIKPSNLMIDRDHRLWVTDFGLARYRTDVSLTQTGDIVGTMRYMSPEQACGDSASVDGRSDVFSLGVTLYEMLSLRPAHDAEDAVGVLRCVDQGLTTPLRQVRGDLPLDLETVIAKAMSADRRDRYDTAADFASDMRRVLDGQPTVARPPSTLDRLESRIAKHQRAVALALILATVGLFGLSIGIAKIAAAKRDSDSHGRQLEQFKQVYNDSFDRLGQQIERLAETPGTEEIQTQLFREMLAAYEKLAIRADRDPLLKQDQARHYGKIGELHHELGDNAKAIEALECSEAIYKELCQAAPDEVPIRAAWGIIQNNLGQARYRSGDFKLAAKWYRKAIHLQEQLAPVATPEDRTMIKKGLATSLSNLGLLLADCGATSEAEDAFHRAIGLAEHGSSEEQLATYHSNLAGLLAGREPSRSAQHAKQALEIQWRAHQAKPEDAGLATRVMVSLNHLGKSLAKREDHLAAIEAFDRSIQVGRPLHQRWPDQPNYRRDLVISLNQRGLSLAANGHSQQAAESFHEAIQLQRVLAQDYADNAEVQSMTGSVLNNLGFLQSRLGQTDAARESFVEAVRYQTAATQLAPQIDRYRAFLDKHRQNLTRFGGTL